MSRQRKEDARFRLKSATISHFQQAALQPGGGYILTEARLRKAPVKVRQGACQGRLRVDKSTQAWQRDRRLIDVSSGEAFAAPCDH